MISSRLPHAARLGAGLLAISLLSTASRAEETLVEIETRPGVTVPLLADAPPGRPAAVALLFPGGNGKVALWKFNPPKSRNFLVRARSAFVAAGLAAVVVDVPSDRRREGLVGFRGSDEHRADIASAVKWARARWAAPVWLVGTSRGTTSAAHLGALPGVDGVVLSSTVTKPSRRNPATAMDAKLEDIRVPVLLVHHRHDECFVTPPESVAELVRRLTGARKVETLWFDGGDPPISEACQARSAHGYLGIEKQVIDATVARMKALSPAAAR